MDLNSLNQQLARRKELVDEFRNHLTKQHEILLELSGLKLGWILETGISLAESRFCDLEAELFGDSSIGSVGCLSVKDSDRQVAIEDLKDSERL